jgi:hypothetical protein
MNTLTFPAFALFAAAASTPMRITITLFFMISPLLWTMSGLLRPHG